MDTPKKHEKIKLAEINSYLTCYLCKGYLIDATTISECLHSFCRSCIIKFLHENSHCPVCEVIINKAKPNLKLDKTLQDIVYKLVPELFVQEMSRRKQFYQKHPSLAGKVSPEQRGEDTERTIFNPQDAISLSIEYISDDSSPGAISVLKDKQTGESPETLMKRYLQCPGMCRIEVLKKFVQNKYNVNTNLFHIDILHKRVPLPDHYTLIDIGYIYSWKRNEPMKFFFRITDINKVSERFDYFDGRPIIDFVIPQKSTRQMERSSKASRKKEATATSQSAKSVAKSDGSAALKPISANCATKTDNSDPIKSAPIKNSDDTIKNNNNTTSGSNSKSSNVLIKREIAEEIKSKLQNGKSNLRDSVYTNITLNRVNNMEVITKIHKVSNKEGHPIGLNIIKHTVKKNNKVQSKANRLNSTNQIGTKPSTPGPNEKLPNPRLAQNRFGAKPSVPGPINEKLPSPRLAQNPPVSSSSSSLASSRSPPSINVRLPLSSVSLPISTAGSTLSTNVNKLFSTSTPVPDSVSSTPNCCSPIAVSSSIPTKSSISPKIDNMQDKNGQVDKEKSEFLKSFDLTAKNFLIATAKIVEKKEKTIKTPKLGQKRKNCSPMKNGNQTKKIKLAMQNQAKNLIHHQNPEVRQIVNNVNTNASSLTKIVEQTSQQQQQKKNELKSLFNNCKIYIPSSLSITLTESSERSVLLPPSIPPVQNYIEILKIPDDDQNKTTSSSPLATSPIVNANNNNSNNKASHQEEDSKKLSITPPIQPSPVPELSPKLFNSSNQTKTAQTFQKIFEESLKKPEPSSTTTTTKDKDDKIENKASSKEKSALDLSSDSNQSIGSNNSGSGGKRKILEIASQLKKTKLEQEIKAKNEEKPEIASNQTNLVPCQNLDITPKVDVPSKLSPQNSASLHSTSLGLNYTVSLGPNCQSTKSGDNTNNTKKGTTTVAKSPNLAIQTKKVSSLGSKSPTKSKASKFSPKIPTPKLSNATKSGQSGGSNLNSNQLLEKYNIQNLAQLTASFNFNNSSNYGGMNSGSHMAALQHAMLLKHIEHQNWLSMNQGPLLQYEKYLQSLSSNQNKLLGNIKEN